MDLQNDDIRRLAAKHFLVANTPMFLFQRLRAESLLQDIASQDELAKVVSEYTASVAAANYDPDARLSVYAAIAVLSMMNGARTVAPTLPKSDKVRWLSDLLLIMMASATNDTSATVKADAAAVSKLIIDTSSPETTYRTLNAGRAACHV
jgi:hypothetical protein